LAYCSPYYSIAKIGFFYKGRFGGSPYSRRYLSSGGCWEE
jgi:hypothetical protein